MDLGKGRGAILLWVTAFIQRAPVDCIHLIKGPVGSPVKDWLATVWPSICRMRARASRLPGSMCLQRIRYLSSRHSTCLPRRALLLIQSEMYIFGTCKISIYRASLHHGNIEALTLPSRRSLLNIRGQDQQYSRSPQCACADTLATGHSSADFLAASVEQFRAPVPQCNCTSATQPGQHLIPVSTCRFVRKASSTR